MPNAREYAEAAFANMPGFEDLLPEEKEPLIEAIEEQILAYYSAMLQEIR